LQKSSCIRHSFPNRNSRANQAGAHSRKANREAFLAGQTRTFAGLRQLESRTVQGSRRTYSPLPAQSTHPQPHCSEFQFGPVRFRSCQSPEPSLTVGLTNSFRALLRSPHVGKGSLPREVVKARQGLVLRGAPGERTGRRRSPPPLAASDRSHPAASQDALQLPAKSRPGRQGPKCRILSLLCRCQVTSRGVQ